MGQSTVWPRNGGNLLLAGLPDADRALIERQLESVTLEPGVVLYDPTSTIDQVYFVDAGLVSFLSVFTDGTAVESAISGREGMVGMAVFHGTNELPVQAVVQLPGVARRMTSPALRECLSNSAALRETLHHYAACLFMFASQSVACMSKHHATRRLARWLLHAGDCSGSDDIALTHLFLSHMLGVRRSSVTIAANALRAKGFITYSRKRFSITDRDGLAGNSCECYGIVRSTYDRFLFGRATESPLAGVESSREGISTLGSPHADPQPRSRRRP